MIIFGTKNVYTFILKIKALKILKDKLTNSYKFNEKEIDELINLIHIIINQNSFQYNAKNYAFVMRNLLSVLLFKLQKTTKQITY